MVCLLIRELGTVNYTNLAVIPGTKTYFIQNVHPLINDVTEQWLSQRLPPVNENYLEVLNEFY
jgi:hypothetical protein